MDASFTTSLWKQRKDASAVNSSCRVEWSCSDNLTALPSVTYIFKIILKFQNN